ncbi:phosphoglycerol transferase MdoB-like AlkP superfamily enzyme [Oxalobacteraceae bacterium GrIS 2.11]
MKTLKHNLHHPTLKRARPASFRLEKWHRFLLYGLVFMLTLSGLLWLVAHFFMQGTNEFGVSISPLEHWSMQLHGALIVPFSFMIGSLLLQHMRRAHQARKNRWSGWFMLSLLSWLTITGYGLYYLASEENRPIWSVLHWLVGCGLPLLLWVHILLGRRYNRGQ